MNGDDMEMHKHCSVTKLSSYQQYGLIRGISIGKGPTNDDPPYTRRRIVPDAPIHRCRNAVAASFYALAAVVLYIIYGMMAGLV